MLGRTLNIQLTFTNLLVLNYLDNIIEHKTHVSSVYCANRRINDLQVPQSSQQSKSPVWKLEDEYDPGWLVTCMVHGLKHKRNVKILKQLNQK